MRAFAASTLVALTGSVAFGLAIPKPASVLTGLVSDERGLPVVGAAVTLPAMKQSVFSNDSGYYRLEGVPAGVIEVRVRQIGYRESSEVLTIPSGVGTVEHNVVLRSVATLDTIEVTAGAGLRDFEENRRIGLGRFLGAADMEKMGHRRLPEILASIGVKSFRIGSRAWIGSSRSVRSMGLASGGRMSNCTTLEGYPVREADRNDPKKNPGCGCFAQVWLDDVLLFSGDERGEVPDINRLAPSSFEAIEYYQSAAQTPMRYSRLNSECGVLVLHTRRTPGSVKRQ